MSLRRERLIMMLALLLVIFFVIEDVFDDWSHGSSLSHIATEIVIVLICLFGFLYTLYKYYSALRASRSIQSDLQKVQTDLATYKNETEHLIQGLGQKIDKQFEDWGLTNAEKEVALLLLKGLSVKEIADVRNASEKTVGQHATAVYQKSHLHGRAELAAFFLEDLFTPNHQT
jgi:DNA-binding CsgD family transcriptional regulator